MQDNTTYQKKVEQILKIKYALLPIYLFEKFKDFDLTLEEGYVFLEIWYLIFDEKINVSENILSDRLGIDEDKILGILANLISKKLISFREESGVLYYDAFSFIESIIDEEDGVKDDNVAEAHVYQAFEGEFKRALSPIEIDFIDEWLNEKFYAEGMIIEVLKLSVTSGKLNFKYIDKVLADWDKKGISTQVENEKYKKENVIGKKATKKSVPSAKRTSKPGKYDDLYE